MADVQDWRKGKCANLDEDWGCSMRTGTQVVVRINGRPYCAACAREQGVVVIISQKAPRRKAVRHESRP